MRCEICGKHEATIAMRQEMNGEAREMHICQDCASKNRELVASSFPLADLLFGIAGGQGTEPVAGRGRSCASCGMSRQEFKTRQRLGCPDCYKTHSAEVASMVGEMQRADRHVGKVPASRRAVVELAGLEKELAKAIEHERYEEAAVLRDRINALKGQKPIVVGGEGDDGC